MTENASKKENRTVFIGMDGSKHAIYAFECKYFHCYEHSPTVVIEEMVYVHDLGQKEKKI